MRKNQTGFTLLELLIVIGILAILAVAIVLVLNPIEFMRQSRDAKRINDLGIINKAISLILVNSNGTIDWDGPQFTDSCFGQSEQKVFVSVPSDNGETPPALPVGWEWAQVVATSSYRIDGYGWLPISFGVGGGGLGAQFPVLPIDPVNTFASGQYFTFVCDSELTAAFESPKFNPNMLNDGGDDDDSYEVGLRLTITPPRLPHHNYAVMSCYGGANSRIACTLDSDCSQGVCLASVIASWSLDEVSGTRYASGTCGADCNLTDNNTVGQDTSSKTEGSASAYFNKRPVPEYLSCTKANCGELYPSGSFTYGCWGNRTSKTASTTPLDQPTAMWTFDWGLQSPPNPLLPNYKTGFALMARASTVAGDFSECWIGRGSGDWSRAFSAIGSFPIDGSFHHTACVYDNAAPSIKNYTDGKGANPVSLLTPIVHSSKNFNIGVSDPGVTDKHWDGQLDECFVHPNALTDKQICEICKFGVKGNRFPISSCNSCAWK